MVTSRGVNLHIHVTLGEQILRKLGKCKCRRLEPAIAEGKKPLTIRGFKPTRVLTFYAKMEYIFGYANLIFLSNQIEKIVGERSFY